MPEVDYETPDDHHECHEVQPVYAVVLQATVTINLMSHNNERICVRIGTAQKAGRRNRTRAG